MIILLREHSHNNDISIYYDDNRKIYYKISLTNYGHRLLENEVMGINFFNKLVSVNKIYFKFYKKKNYFRLEINKIYGNIINYKESFNNNSKYFEKIVKFYLTKWPNIKKNIAHGDLTLDNIFFYKNKITFFDWEHYQSSSKIFFGYDLIYLLLSGIILPGEKKFDFSSKEKFKKLYKQLYNHRINKIYLDNPFKCIDKVISNVFTSILIKSPNKFITISVRKNFKNKIIDFMNKEVI